MTPALATARPSAGYQPSVSMVGVCLTLVVVLCVFEGAARKWLMPNSSPGVQAVFYFMKDVPLLMAVVTAVRARPTVFRHELHGLLTLCTALIVLGALMSVDEATAIGATVSLRSLILLPWAAYLVGPGLVGRKDLLMLLHTIGACSVLNAGLGVVQFTSPQRAVINRTVSEEASIVDMGRVRASGTFAFIGGISDLGVISAWAGTVMLTRSPGSPQGFVYVLSGLVCVSVAMSRSGASGAVWVVALGLLSTRSGRQVIGLLATLAVVTAVAGSLFVGDVSFDVPDPGSTNEEVTVANALVTRHKQADTYDERLSMFLWQVPQVCLEWPLGNGLGRTQNGQAKSVGVDTNMVYEFDLARVGYEIGIAGMVGAAAFRFGVAYLMWRGLRRVAPVGWGAVVWPSFWLLALMPIQMITFNHVLATFLMLVMACVCRADGAGVRR